MNNSTDTAKVCSHKNSFSLDNFLRRLVQPPKKILSPYIKSGDTAVDLGCGPGFFTTAMAELVGEKGSVHAMDLQQEMLDKLARKLQDSPYRDRVQLHRCQANSLNVQEELRADFILAYYMVHETPSQESFFAETRQILKQDGKILVVEPPFHVRKSDFTRSEKIAENAGFTVVDRPKIFAGMSMVLS